MTVQLIIQTKKYVNNMYKFIVYVYIDCVCINLIAPLAAVVAVLLRDKSPLLNLKQ